MTIPNMKRLKSKHIKEKIERKTRIRNLAKEMGWSELFEREHEAFIRFKRDELVVDIWYTTMSTAVYKETENRGIQPSYSKIYTHDDLVEFLANPE